MFALMKCGYRVMLLDAQNPHQLDEHFVTEAGVKAFITHRPTGIPDVLDVDIAQVEGWTTRRFWATRSTTHR